VAFQLLKKCCHYAAVQCFQLAVSDYARQILDSNMLRAPCKNSASDLRSKSKFSSTFFDFHRRIWVLITSHFVFLQGDLQLKYLFDDNIFILSIFSEAL